MDKRILGKDLAVSAVGLGCMGVSEANETYIRRAHTVCPITAIQNRYSMMARHYEPLFPVLEELHIGYVAFSPMANGFLTGKYDQNATFDANTDYRSMMPQYSAEGMEKNQKLLEMLQNTAEKKNATSAQISLAWMLCKKPWNNKSCALAGWFTGVRRISVCPGAGGRCVCPPEPHLRPGIPRATTPPGRYSAVD
jgi:aryl-alcohol dehydrogenase-like predicted oxidoreductase